MDENKVDYDREILLVADKKSGRLRAVAGMNEKGDRIKTIEPSMKNVQQFLTVEKKSGDLEKFLKNFMAQFKNPSDTAFYKMRVNGLENGVKILEGLLNHAPDAPSVAESRINPKDYAKPAQSNDSKILLTRDEDGKWKVITGIGEDGKLKTTDPTKENANSFFKFDTGGNALDSFLKKFSEQSENPSHTGLYAFTLGAVDKVAGFLDKIAGANPEDKALDPYRVGAADGRIGEQSLGNYQPLDLNKVDWKEAEKLGISAEDMRDALKAMVYGHKSPGLVDIKTEVDGKELTVQARLSLQEQPDGSIKFQAHPRQEKIDYEAPFMGVTFTEKDREQFGLTGNGGRVFEIEREPGSEKIPALISVDKLTNRFEAKSLSEINIPQTLKNAPLSGEQQAALKQGDGVLIEGMDKKVKPGEEPSKIDRIVQYNAANRNFDFRFTDQQRQQHREERQARQEQSGQDKPLKARQVDGIWIRPVQGGVELSKEQFEKLCRKEPVFVEGMQKPQPKQKEGARQVEATDRKGQKYNAWVWPDAEKGHVRHTSKHPDEQKADESKKVTPAESHKTQVAVNNDGKTNEPTKHAQSKGEALKSGQTNPTAKQDEKQKESHQRKQSPAAPKKSAGKGRKIG